MPPQGDEISHPGDLNHGGDIDVPGDRAPHAAASACASVHGPARLPLLPPQPRRPTAGRGQKDQPRSIQDFLTQSVDGASVASAQGLTAEKAQANQIDPQRRDPAVQLRLEGPPKPDGCDEGGLTDAESLPPPPAPAPQVRLGSRGRVLKGRRKAADCWRCEWCDFVADGKWYAKRFNHVRAWHPEHLHLFSQRVLPVFRLPGPTDTVLWPCPCCNLALLEQQPPISKDTALKARLRHQREHHPGVSKKSFLLPTTRDNAPKATRAVLAAGVAPRLLQRRTGEYGDHKVVFFRIPWLGSAVKKARATRLVHFCTACAQYGDTPKRLRALRCAPSPGSAGRSKFIAKLRAALEEEHSPELLAAVKRLLKLLTASTDRQTRRVTGKRCPPPALRKHEVVVVA